MDQSTEYRECEAERAELLRERYELALGRIREIAEKSEIDGDFADYFRKTARFLMVLDETGRFIAGGGLENAPLEELAERNRRLYEDILPEHYDESYANPSYAAHQLCAEHGQLLAVLYAELRSMIPFVYEKDTEELVIRMELFIEVYGAYLGAAQEAYGQDIPVLPEPESIRQILYWFASDYEDMAASKRIRNLVVAQGDDNLAVRILQSADLTDVRYLYAYGEYVNENALETARFLAQFPQETIATMADTCSEGYRIGFEATGKDLTRKRTADLEYPIGFERMMRRVMENLERLGLQPVCHRVPTSILYHPTLSKRGLHGDAANRQYEYDHKDDRALFLDKAYVNRMLEVSRTAFERYKQEALGYAGPVVLETFGEKDFSPINCPDAIAMDDAQNALWVDYRSRAGAQQREYILEEERSFTIIAFPVPEIKSAFGAEILSRYDGNDAEQRNACYRDFFEEIIRVNTLDYQLYRRIQQTLIDALDAAEHCEVKGMGDNRTELRVQLRTLAHPDRETQFENCVADVNIPVGEVFTSPVLTGTRGVLHVTRVFLNGLEYRELEIRFEDGRISGYVCANFSTERENHDFIYENILFRHPTLPIGEFAIGTNTTAYVAARRYGVQEKLPILIAEKTGPHFAVGDTCYSHAEDIAVFNPDGKEIISRDNEVSLLRKTDASKAYFNCHTDITIPYDELGELTAVRADGTRIPIIREGRFVLPGTEKLNEPLDFKAN